MTDTKRFYFKVPHGFSFRWDEGPKRTLATGNMGCLHTWYPHIPRNTERFTLCFTRNRVNCDNEYHCEGAGPSWADPSILHNKQPVLMYGDLLKIFRQCIKEGYCYVHAVDGHEQSPPVDIYAQAIANGHAEPRNAIDPAWALRQVRGTVIACETTNQPLRYDEHMARMFKAIGRPIWPVLDYVRMSDKKYINTGLVTHNQIWQSATPAYASDAQPANDTAYAYVNGVFTVFKR